MNIENVLKDTYVAGMQIQYMPGDSPEIEFDQSVIGSLEYCKKIANRILNSENFCEESAIEEFDNNNYEFQDNESDETSIEYLINLMKKSNNLESVVAATAAIISGEDDGKNGGVSLISLYQIGENILKNKDSE